jgi:transposase
MKKQYHVELTPDQRQELQQLIASGEAKARQLSHARVLLKADCADGGPARSDAAICEAVEVSPSTVVRIRQRFAQEGLEAALKPKAQQHRKARQLDGEQEAHLIALVCGDAPDGYARWSLRLLADTMVELGYVGSVSHETVRQTLKKTS